MRPSSPSELAPADTSDTSAWPRGLQVFALVAFMTNLAAVVYLVH